MRALASCCAKARALAEPPTWKAALASESPHGPRPRAVERRIMGGRPTAERFREALCAGGSAVAKSVS